MLNHMEKKILKKISDSQLVTKMELIKHLNANGIQTNGSSMELALKNLIGQNLLSMINPVGSTCFVITKKGSKTLSEMEY